MGGTDQMLAALQELDANGTILLNFATFDTLANEIDRGIYDIIFVASRSESVPAAAITSLDTWIAGGGSAILSSWEDNASLNALFETNPIGTNLTTATFNDHVMGFELSIVAVSDPGWPTYALQLEATGTGYSVCSWENDTSCAVVGNGGNTIRIGFLNDSISAMNAERVVRNSLWQVSL